jgi:hypothetical protein
VLGAQHKPLPTRGERADDPDGGPNRADQLYVTGCWSGKHGVMIIRPSRSEPEKPPPFWADGVAANVRVEPSDETDTEEESTVQVTPLAVISFRLMPGEDGMSVPLTVKLAAEPIVKLVGE